MAFSRDTTLASLMRAAATRAGVGRMQGPVPADSWEAQYADGGWDYLYEIGEVAHYMAIMGYTLYHSPRPDILDIGCGQGRFAELLDSTRFGSYHGVDLSLGAVEQARGRGIAGAVFEAADSNVWQPSRRFDVIVYNESLYYLEDPMGVLSRSTSWLTDGGLIVISMFRGANVQRLWRQIDRLGSLRLEDRSRVRNHHRMTWDVGAYRVQR